jgi:hypothetical protein
VIETATISVLSAEMVFPQVVASRCALVMQSPASRPLERPSALSSCGWRARRFSILAAIRKYNAARIGACARLRRQALRSNGLAQDCRAAIAAAGKSAVIPPRPDRATPRQFDREYKEYKERHLIENLFSKLKQPAP